jgi:hypothetical protein
MLQPFAWESREFLRKKLIGKEVSFTVEYKVPSGREFGTVFLGSKSSINLMPQALPRRMSPSRSFARALLLSAREERAPSLCTQY